MEGFIYLATPYSHPNADVRHRRYKDAARIVASLIKTGYLVYSPIVHFHMCAVLYDLPTGAEFWNQLNERMLAKAEKMFIANMEGYEDSKGIHLEMDFCERNNIPYEILDVKGILNG